MGLETGHDQVGDQVDDPHRPGHKGDVFQLAARPLDHFDKYLKLIMAITQFLGLVVSLARHLFWKPDCYATRPNITRVGTVLCKAMICVNFTTTPFLL